MESDKYVILVNGGYWNDEKHEPVVDVKQATVFSVTDVYKKRRKLIKKFSQVFVKIIH